MGIRVECPNGHVFKVKDKYAGKKGLCPYCTGHVHVTVPDLMTSTTETIKHFTAQNRPPTAPQIDPSSSTIFDDPLTAQEQSPSSSGSLLSGSFVQHRVVCHKCGAKAPMWYAKCPACGVYLNHD